MTSLTLALTPRFSPSQHRFSAATMVPMSSPGHRPADSRHHQKGQLRICDKERATAIDALSQAMSEGRLSLQEFDERSRQVAEALTYDDLSDIFKDLPQDPFTPVPLSKHPLVTSALNFDLNQPGPLPPSVMPSQLLSPQTGTPMSAGPVEERRYTYTEVSRMHRSGLVTRLGIFGIGSVITTCGMIMADVMFASSALVALIMSFIPILFFLLFFIKIGPASWYVPSPRQLDRQRIQELKALDEAHRTAVRMQKRERQHEISTNVTDLVREWIDRRS